MRKPFWNRPNPTHQTHIAFDNNKLTIATAGFQQETLSYLLKLAELSTLTTTHHALHYTNTVGITKILPSTLIKQLIDRTDVSILFQLQQCEKGNETETEGEQNEKEMQANIFKWSIKLFSSLMSKNVVCTASYSWVTMINFTRGIPTHLKWRNKMKL